MNRLARSAAGAAVVSAWLTAAPAEATETVPTPPPPPGIYEWQEMPAAVEATRPIEPELASRYADEFAVTMSEATRRLELQRVLIELDARLREELGPDYAGVYFDNESGRAGVLARGQAAAATAATLVEATASSAKGISVETVAFSLDELEQVQRRVDRSLRGELERSIAQTMISARDNVVGIALAADAPAASAKRVAELAEDPRIAIRTVPASLLRTEPLSCGWPNCSRPLRGGVSAFLGNSTKAIRCTTAFSGYTANERVVFSAGHCADGIGFPGESETGPWYAREHPAPKLSKIGARVGWYFGVDGDAAIIRTDGSQCGWCPDVASPTVALWGISEAHPVEARGWAAQGLYACRAGATTALSCGEVTYTNLSHTYGDGSYVSGMFKTSACSEGGDSGGPHLVGYKGIGITSGGLVAPCTDPSDYTIAEEILDAEQRLDAWVLQN